MSPVGVNPSCFLKRRLDSTNQAEFFQDLLWILLMPRLLLMHREHLASTAQKDDVSSFFMGFFTTQKRKQWGLPLILAATWRFCSLKNHHLHNLHRAKEIPVKPSVHWQWMETADLNKNDLAQRFAPMMWHNSFSTNWGHLFFVFDRHGKNLF